MTDPTRKPVPAPSDLSAPYWEAARQGRLELQRCRACRHWVHFPDPRCPLCGSEDLGFEEVSGHGTVETFTVVHRSFVPGFAEDAPDAVGWVALPEQPLLRVFAGFTGIEPDDLMIGLPVTACFVEREGWGLIPAFTVADPATTASPRTTREDTA